MADKSGTGPDRPVAGWKIGLLIFGAVLFAVVLILTSGWLVTDDQTRQALLAFERSGIGINRQWLSDLLLGAGTAILLAPAILWIEQRSKRRTNQVREQVDLVQHDVEQLESSDESAGRTLKDVQQEIDSDQTAAWANSKEVLTRVLHHAEFEDFKNMLDFARGRNLVSPHGVRGELGWTTYMLRVRADGDALLLHLDMPQTVKPRATVRWEAGTALSSALGELFEGVKDVPIGEWGVERAVTQISNALTAAEDYRARGTHVERVVQLVDDWLLTDWQAIHIGRPYGVEYSRLGDLDWNNHLSGKPWTDAGSVGQMLDRAAEIKSLAEDEASGS